MFPERGQVRCVAGVFEPPENFPHLTALGRFQVRPAHLPVFHGAAQDPFKDVRSFAYGHLITGDGAGHADPILQIIKGLSDESSDVADRNITVFRIRLSWILQNAPQQGSAGVQPVFHKRDGPDKRNPASKTRGSDS